MIFIVRHGETNLNKNGLLQGRIGLPLNQNGIKQAENLKEKLSDIKFDYVFSSPQERAIQTAKIISGVDPIIDSRIDVLDLGTADNLKKEDVKRINNLPDPNYYQGVENPKHFVKRIFMFMTDLVKYHNKTHNILIIGHRCTTGCFSAFLENSVDLKDIVRLGLSNGEIRVYNFINEKNIFEIFK